MSNISADTVAQYIIKICAERKYHINNFRLQKLLYFAQASSLVSRKMPLFTDQILAYDFGPVVKCVYDKYKVYALGDLGVVYRELDCTLPKEEASIVKDVIDSLLKYSDSDLLKIALRQDPWKESYNRYVRKNIPNELIYSFFMD